MAAWKELQEAMYQLSVTAGAEQSPLGHPHYHPDSSAYYVNTHVSNEMHETLLTAKYNVNSIRATHKQAARRQAITEVVFNEMMEWGGQP